MSPPDGETNSASGGDDPSGQTVDFDEQALYVVVRSAVEDAILDVLGTIMLLGFALVIVWVGGTFALSGESIVAVGTGLLAIAFGFYVAATALEIIPPAGEWF